MTRDRVTPDSDNLKCPLDTSSDAEVATLSDSESDKHASTLREALQAALTPIKRKRSPRSSSASRDDQTYRYKKPKIESAAGSSPQPESCDRESPVPEVKPVAEENRTPNSAKKRRGRPSQISSKDLEAKRRQTMKCLNKFMKISQTYSEFLERKIQTSQPSTSDPTKHPKKKSLSEQLNFFKGTLRPYQLEGVTWLTILYENSVNGILADEMGLGKTIQIIALFAHLYERKAVGPFLIVVPLSTLANWEQEFARFAPELPVLRLQGNRLEREEQMRKIRKPFTFENRAVKPVVLCSYQMVPAEKNFLQTFLWHYVVVDEGHKIKNPEAQLSRELRALRSSNRTLLTGTPLQNDIRELWALFNFLMPKLFKNEEVFSTLINLDDMRDTEKLLENEATTKVIETIHKMLAPFMLRREKKFVLPDIVPKKEVIIYCPLTPLQKYQYMATLQRDYNKLKMGTEESEILPDGVKRTRCKRPIRYVYEEDDEASPPTNNAQPEVKTASRSLIRNNNVPFNLPDCPFLLSLPYTNVAVMLKNITNHPYLLWTPIHEEGQKRTLEVGEHLIQNSGKLLALEAMLPKLKHGGHKVLIFSTSVMFLDMIEEMLIMRRHSYTRLDGRTKYTDRKQNIAEFSSDDELFIFLLSTRAGGQGVNLTAADTVIFMDRDWNPMADLQAQDRCHRIGQTKPVMIYSLITKGTIDELVLDRGQMKRRLEKIVLQEGKFKTMKKNFSSNDLKELEKLLKEVDVSVKIRSNGLLYTNQEWDQILDRQDLLDQMKEL